MLLLTSVAALAGLTLLLASLLVLAERKLRVEEDPRIDAVDSMLPHANCGACGLPGCLPFAEALVRGEVLPGGCTVATAAERTRIADYLGVAVGTQNKRVARLACAGGKNVARTRARYDGLMSCRAAAQVAGGGKSCFWGCIGLGDCAQSCDFDAIEMDADELPRVDEELCTACGDCVDVCPKDLFSLNSIDDRLWVRCRSGAAGDELTRDCEVACTACGRCAVDAPEVIRMQDNLPVVDYGRQALTRHPIERCPTGAIVWIDAEAGVVKGAAATRILRRSALPEVPT